MMKGAHVISGLAIGTILLACASQAYVLPVADGSVKASPPSIQGRIARVDVGEIDVLESEEVGVAAGTVLVRFGQSTRLFTVYGGYVSTSDLLEGQHVRVWLDKPGPVDPSLKSHAAVIVLASKDPRDDWP